MTMVVSPQEQAWAQAERETVAVMGTIDAAAAQARAHDPHPDRQRGMGRGRHPIGGALKPVVRLELTVRGPLASELDCLLLGVGPREAEPRTAPGPVFGSDGHGWSQAAWLI